MNGSRNEEEQDGELNLGVAELFGEVGQFFQVLRIDFREITEAFDILRDGRVVERSILENIRGNVMRDLAHISDDLENMNRSLGELDQDLDLYDDSIRESGESERPAKPARH
jgi:hypothetical protein